MSDIIFLHGASSSGKSTLARELQTQISQPFWHVSIDHLRDSGMLPSQRFKQGDFNWPEYRDRFFNGFHLSLKSYADAGNHLILEHIIDKAEWMEELRSLFQGHSVLFVGVHCPLDVLARRERERGDRPVGSAENDYFHIHQNKKYDIDVNTTDMLSINVDKILIAWKSNRRTSSFYPS